MNEMVADIEKFLFIGFIFDQHHIPIDHPKFEMTAEKWSYLITMTTRMLFPVLLYLIHFHKKYIP